MLSTQAMSAPLAAALESLSGYRAVFPPGDPRVSDNPVVFSHVHLAVAGKSYSVLSRISDYGLDYSQRANKIAHHLVLGRKEQVTGGPAAVLGQPGIMESTWSGKPRVIPTGRNVTAADVPLAPCRAWQQATGDAGWAGVLAESFQADPGRHAYLVVAPGMDVLPLIAEAVHLLPGALRWNVTFSTYFTSLPPGTTCQWRCVLAGSPEAQQSRRFVQALRIDLTQPMPKATGGALVEQARTGRIAPPTNVAITSSPSPTHPPIENPAPSDSPPMVPLDGGNRAARQSSGGPPPPPRKRTRTLADVPDVPRRQWVVPAMLAALVFLMLGAAGAGFYFWRPGDRLGQDVAAAGTDAKAIESQQAPAPPKATKTSTSTENPQEHSEKSVAQSDTMPPLNSPVEKMPTEDHGDPDAKDASAPPAKPMNLDNTSQEPSDKDDEPLAEEALEEPTQSAPILHWAALQDASNGPLTTRDNAPLKINLNKDANRQMELLIPKSLQSQLRGKTSQSQNSPQSLEIEYQHLNSWNKLAVATVQSDGEHSRIEWKWWHKAKDFQQRLTWCVIQIGDKVPQYVVLHKNHTNLNRDLKDGHIAWEPEVDVSDDVVSQLSFDATILIQGPGDVLTFSTSIDEMSSGKPNRTFTIESIDVARSVSRRLDFDMPQEWKQPIGVQISVGKNNKQAVRLSLIYEQTFSDLHDHFDKIRCGPVNQTLRSSANGIQAIIPNFAKSPSVSFTLLVDKSRSLVQDIKKGVGDWMKVWEISKNNLMQNGTPDAKTQIEVFDSHKKELMKIVGDGSSHGVLDELHEQAADIQSVEDDLKAATIISAEIYYTVQDSNGKSLNVPIIRIPELSSPQK